VTLLDANVLLYAYNADAPQHAASRTWLEEQFSKDDWIGLSWLSIWAFLRVSTNSRLFPQPLAGPEAFAIVRDLLARPRVVLVEPGPRHCALLEGFVVDFQAGGVLVTDAAQAALAAEQGAILASTDQDFRRFPGIRWLNPLDPKPI
jgi:toxin-antitoxin system PIN domain toxin